MFIWVDLGLTNAYRATLANRFTPTWASKSVIGGENIGERNACTSR